MRVRKEEKRRNRFKRKKGRAKKSPEILEDKSRTKSTENKQAKGKGKKGKNAKTIKEHHRGKGAEKPLQPSRPLPFALRWHGFKPGQDRLHAGFARATFQSYSGLTSGSPRNMPSPPTIGLCKKGCGEEQYEKVYFRSLEMRRRENSWPKAIKLKFFLKILIRGKDIDGGIS